MVSIAVEGVKRLSRRELRELAADLQSLIDHCGGKGPEALNDHNKRLYAEIKRVWADRGVQLSLF